MSRQGTLPRTRSRVWLNLTTCGSIKQSNCAHFGLWPCQTSTLIASRASARSRAEQRTLPERARISVQQRHGSLVNQLGAAPKQYVPRPPAATKATRAAALWRAAPADDKSTSECLLFCLAVRARYYGRCGLGFTERTQRAAAADDGATTRQDGAIRDPSTGRDQLAARGAEGLTNTGTNYI